MKLTEARYAANPEVVWVQDLEYNDIVEYDDAPFVDPKTGILVIAIDAKWEGAYVNPQTFNYEETKLELPWSVELAGTRAQIEQFLNLYFPHWEEDQLHQSDVWDQKGIDRVVKHVQNKKKIMSRNLDEQVTRILEAKYHKEPTPKEVHEMYVTLFEREQQHQFGKIIMVEHDYVDDGIFGVENKCYAVLYLWVMDSTRSDAEQHVIEFLEEMDVPYNDIDLDTGVLSGHPSFTHSRIHTSVMYMGPCEDNVTEAKYIGTTKTTSVMRHQVNELYKKHATTTGTRSNPHIQAQQKKMWPRETTAGDPGIIPLISFWYNTDREGWPATKTQAEKDAKQYMNDNNLPYTSNTVATRYGASVIQVVFKFGERKDLSEARHASMDLSVEEVLGIYKKISRRLSSQNDRGYNYYDSEKVGRVTYHDARIDTEYNPSPTAEFGVLIHNCESEQEAVIRLRDFIKEVDIPYNDIEHGQNTGDNKFAFIIQYRDPHAVNEARYHGGAHDELRKHIIDLVDGYGYEDIDARWFEMEVRKGPEEIVPILTKHFGEPHVKEMGDNKGYTWKIPGRGKINMLTWVGRQTHNELDSVEAFYHYDDQLR